MPPTSYDYAVIRVVPRVDRGEFINAGIVLANARRGFLRAALALDEQRLLVLDPGADVAAIRAALRVFPLVCAGGPEAGALGRLSLRERFDWLVAPRSSSVQTSPVHSGRCQGSDLATTLDHLLQRMVHTPGAAAG